MKAGPRLSALVGFAGGMVVVVLTLALELKARGEALGGGLARLQMDSVVVWVLESMPFLIAGAAAAIAASGTLAPIALARPAHEGKPEVDEPLAEGPPPSPEQDVAPAPEVPDGEAEAEADQRVRALQELARVLKANAARATAESRAKSAYLASLSDELRSPLHTILGHADTLVERASDEGLGIEASLSEVSAAAHRLSTLINNLLDLSKIELGSLSIVLEDVDVAQIVEEVRASRPQKSAGSLITSVADDARFARGDHMRLRQIVSNLVHEVYRQPPAGNVTVSVKRTPAAQGAWVAIEVKDPGRCLTEQQRAHMFDALEEGRTSGLGLSIGRRLAELMGGRLEVTSSEGAGTAYTLVLPPSTDTDTTQAPARSQVALNERLSSLRLALLDGSPGAATLGRYLEKAGLDVEVCAHIAVLRESLAASMPAIAVVDASLDGGWAVAEDLVGKNVPVVVMSLRDEDVERALQLGVTAFLTRPVERKLLLATLERCLHEGH